MNPLNTTPPQGKKVLTIGIITSLILLGEIVITPALVFAFMMGYSDDPATAAHPFAVQNWSTWLVIFFLLGYPLIYLLGLIFSLVCWFAKKYQGSLFAIKIPVFYLLTFVVYLAVDLLVESIH